MNNLISANQSILPLFDTNKVDSTIFLGDNYLQVSEYRPMGEMFPEYFHVDRYVVEILVEGELHCSINLRKFDVKAPCVLALLPDSVLHIDYASENSKLMIIALNEQFAKDLQIPDWSYRIVQAIRSHPLGKLTEKQMKIVAQYFYLIKEVLAEQNINPNVQECVLKLSNSFSNYLQGCFIATFERQTTLTRSEQLTEDFIRLVEQYYCEHKKIAWYAGQLHITPKYLANVIKSTTGKPAGSWLDDYVLLQAKTMLTSSRLTIQQIADRLGFQNQSHFGTFFRRHTNKSPKAFRERQ